MWPRSPKKEEILELGVGSAFDRLVQHFRTQQWTFNVDKEERVLSTTLSGQSGQIQVVAAISGNDDTLEVIATLPVNAPVNKRYEAAEFCLRSCEEMRMGRFEVDFDDGAIRFHGSTLYDDGDLPEAVIHRCVGITLTMADHFFPHLMSVIYGGVTASHAAQLARNQLVHSS